MATVEEVVDTPAQVVEEVDTDDEMPDLEESQPQSTGPKTTTDIFGNETTAKVPGKQSRSEKKARKAMKNLGMKPVPGINRVTVKKAKNILFVISDPDVLKSPASDTYIIFGDAKIEDINSQNAAAAAEQFSTPEDLTASVPDLVGDEEESGDEEADATGISEENISTLMQNVQCSRNKAIKALQKTSDNLIEAIMSFN